MRSLRLVARREFAAYWTSPVAYVVLTVFAVLSGIFFFGELSSFVAVSARNGGRGVDVNQDVLGPYFNTVSVIVLFLLPLVSMRLIAEERRQGTLEILLTTPAPDWAIVIGKYVASLGLYVALLVVAGLHVTILFVFGSPEWGPVVTGFLGLLLTGAAYLAIGILLSASTQNQVVAAALAFSLFLALWLASWLSGLASGSAAAVLSYVSFAGHFHNFSRGVLDSADVLYYLSLIAAGLFTATQVVSATRWKA